MLHRRIASLLLVTALALPLGIAQLSAQSSEEVLTPRTFINVSKQTLPSVVSISVRDRRMEAQMNENNPLLGRMFQYFSNQGKDLDPRQFFGSSGSGFIFRVEEGTAFVLTNNHVLRDATGVDDVRLRLDESWGVPVEEGEYEDIPIINYGTVEIAGRDTLSDLAVLKFPVPDGVQLKALDFADSAKIEVGEWVIALGNPLELNNSVSQGIVSAKHRNLGTDISIQRLLQTTATINPGNSGGPLVNLSGKVIGVNNAIATSNGLWQGVGFAIPSNDALRIGNDLAQGSEVSRGYLGIQMSALALYPERARQYGIEDLSGVVITNVLPGSPADLAGMREWDVVTRLNKRRVATTNDLLRAIASQPSGGGVDLQITRLEEGEVTNLTLTATLTQRPTDEQLAAVPMQEAKDLPNPDSQILELDNLEAFGIVVSESRGSAGLRIIAVIPNSGAEAAGLRIGDIITRWNGKRVRIENDVQDALGLSRDGAHSITYTREGSTMYATIESR